MGGGYTQLRASFDYVDMIKVYKQLIISSVLLLGNIQVRQPECLTTEYIVQEADKHAEFTVENLHVRVTHTCKPSGS